MNATLTIAFVRGIGLGLVAAGTAFFGALATIDAATVEQAGVLAGLAFFTSLGARWGVEGRIDSGNDAQRTLDAAKRAR